jgi:hypothetical protein
MEDRMLSRRLNAVKSSVVIRRLSMQVTVQRFGNCLCLHHQGWYINYISTRMIVRDDLESEAETSLNYIRMFVLRHKTAAMNI